jgi:CBS domain-containing protein
MKLSDLFSKGAITALPDDTLASVAQKMLEHNVGAVVIVQGERPIGIITDRDLALALGAEGVLPEEPARRLMTRRVLTIADDAGIFTATRFMKECEVRRLPIVDRQDRLVGIVTLDDLLRCVGRELYNLAEGIRHEVEVVR